MVGRTCSATAANGRVCRATPMRDAAFCFWHNPESDEEVTEARRLGGIRRRREKAVASAYDLGSLDTVGALRRVLELAVFDALGLENSIARARVLLSAVLAGAKLLEVGDFEARLAELEAAVRVQATPVLDDIEDDAA